MARPNPAKNLSWEDAIQVVLKEVGGSLHYTDMAQRIAAQGLRSAGPNPARSVAATLSRMMNDEDSPIQKIGRGEYALKEVLQSEAQKVSGDDIVNDGSETGALRAFGVFWRRDLVSWDSRPTIMGRQGLGASPVDFSEQVGVYLLHDRDRVIYVGRADDTMLARLRAHTTDRLGGRWDRFSWFGLRSVLEDGSLSTPANAWTHEVVLATLEALLIESLEPPLNRRRGDNFTGAEYQQVADPETRKRQEKALLTKLLDSQS